MWGFLIAILSGALMSVQGVFNTGLTKQSSMWSAASFVQFSGFLTCLAIWLFRDRTNMLKLFSVDNKWMLTGGIIGAFITYSVVKSIEELSPAKAILTIVISQLAVAYGIELFGLFGAEKVAFEWRKLIGILIALVGIVTFQW